MRMKVGGPLRVRHWQWGWTDGILLQKPSGKGSRTQGKAMVQVRCMDERFPTTLDNLSRPTADFVFVDVCVGVEDAHAVKPLECRGPTQ